MESNIIRQLISYSNDKKKLFYSLLFLVVILFLVQGILGVLYNDSWLDEGKYLLKSYYYTTGEIQPYSGDDKTGYMPFYFYLLGYWQMIFGFSHVSGRFLSLFLTMINLFLLFGILKKETNSKFWALLGPLFVVLHPFVMFYYTTATPYAMVSTFVLLTVFVINKEYKNIWNKALLLGILYFLIYFTRRNMILFIVPVFIFQIITMKKKRTIFLTISIFLLLSVSAFSLWGNGLANIAKSLPIVTPLIKKLIAIFQNGDIKIPSLYTYSRPYSLVNNGWRASFHGLINSGIRIYLIPLLFSIAAIIEWGRFRSHELKKYAILGSLYIFLFVFHWYPTIFYCNGCIRPYGSYFYYIGIIVVIGYLSYKHKEKIKTGTIKCIFITLVFSITIMNMYSIGKDRLYYFSHPSRSYISKVKNVADVMDRYFPDNSAYIPLGGLYYTVHAGMYSDNRPEITMINQYHSYKSLNSTITVPMEEIIRQDKEVFFWNDDLMLYWIRTKYDYFVVGDGIFTDKFLPEIELYFTKVHELSLPKQKIGFYIRNKD